MRKYDEVANIFSSALFVTKIGKPRGFELIYNLTKSMQQDIRTKGKRCWSTHMGMRYRALVPRLCFRPPPSSHPLDGPEHALPPEAETTNQDEASGDLKDFERVNAESAGSRAVPAALAASLPLAAPAGVTTRAAADAPAPRKKRSRPFN